MKFLVIWSSYGLTDHNHLRSWCQSIFVHSIFHLNSTALSSSYKLPSPCIEIASWFTEFLHLVNFDTHLCCPYALNVKLNADFSVVERAVIVIIVLQIQDLADGHPSSLGQFGKEEDSQCLAPTRGRPSSEPLVLSWCNTASPSRQLIPSSPYIWNKSV